jgi:hypothetical protein
MGAGAGGGEAGHELPNDKQTWGRVEGVLCSVDGCGFGPTTSPDRARHTNNLAGARTPRRIRSSEAHGALQSRRAPGAALTPNMTDFEANR